MFTLKRRSLGDNLLYHPVKVKGESLKPPVMILHYELPITHNIECDSLHVTPKSHS